MVGFGKRAWHSGVGVWLAASVEDRFQRSSGMSRGQGIAQPVADDRQLDTGKALEELKAQAVGGGQGHMAQKPRDALVADVNTVAAGGMGERTGQEGLPDAGGATDKNIEVLVAPFALGQLKDEAMIQATRGREVKVHTLRTHLDKTPESTTRLTTRPQSRQAPSPRMAKRRCST
jgi:hypothetical protein